MTAGVLLPPDDIAVVVEGEATTVGRSVAVLVARLPNGPLYRLDGSAAVIWEEAVGQDEAGLVTRVVRRTGVNADVVAEDVRRFLAELVGLGLLAPTDEKVAECHAVAAGDHPRPAR